MLNFSWVVKRVTFKDVYKVTLKATFETNVPMPVVTITPQELDLDVLQRGLMPVINFELTNHGLIRAEDVKFRLPSSNSHPFMHFEMVRNTIFSLNECVLHKSHTGLSCHADPSLSSGSLHLPLIYRVPLCYQQCKPSIWSPHIFSTFPL